MKIIKTATKQAKRFAALLLSPRQTNEDDRRQELILNILLFFSTASFFIINIIRIADYALYPEKRGLPLNATVLIFAFFAGLLWLSRRGRVKLAASLLVITFSLPMFYSFLTWGTDLPAAILLAVLVITLSGVLLGARLAFSATSIISLFLLIATYGQTHGTIKVQSYWRDDPSQIGDIICYIALLFIIAAISWIFCREINHSLKRARLSEKLLREERDSLEVKVIERTKELRELEAEKINQLYRFAEFGRLSSGIFHDLINPLTAVSLNLEQIKAETDTKISSAKSYLSQALLATSKMEGLIASIKKQISRESTIKPFCLNQEIKQVVQILDYKARRAQADLRFSAGTNIELEGDAIKFDQIITNLLANAIEACENSATKRIKIDLERQAGAAVIRIADSGIGILPQDLPKIFEPFFSTKKNNGQGLGLGLASTKTIIEKDFSGNIAVASEPGRGTAFTIIFPIQAALPDKKLCRTEKPITGRAGSAAD